MDVKKMLRKFSLLGQVIIAALLGVFLGLLIGEKAAVLKPIGQIYTMLMEVVVFPYLVCTLITSLGDLTPALTLRLLKKGWVIYIFLVLITFALLIILGNAIPINMLYGSAEIAEQKTSQSLLSYLIPENFFYDLANNYVPAVIVFCILFALVLQHVPNKKNLFVILRIISQTCLLVWSWLVKLVPLATFALLANLAGTIRLNQLIDVSEFLILFFIGSIILIFWLLPMLISGFTGLRYKDIMYELRDALIVSAVTTLSVVALPYLEKITTRFMQQRSSKRAIDQPDVLKTLLLINYPLAQLGNFFVYLFILFAGLYYNHPFTELQYLSLPIFSYFSSIGSPSSSINSVAFLTNLMTLPNDTTALYVSLMPIIRYGQVLASVMGFAFLAIVIMFSLLGSLKINYRILLLHSILVFGLVTIFVIFLKNYVPNPGEKSFQRLNNLSIDYARFNVKATIAPAFDETKILPSPAKEDSLFRIQRTGVLRVGFNADMRPFAFYNNYHQLVGYDIAYAYALAKALNAHLEFVPFTWQYLVNDLAADKFDIAMSAIYVTETRLASVTFTEPYFQSPLAFIVPVKYQTQYQTREQIRSAPNMRIGVFQDPVLIPLIQQNFPKAKIVILENVSGDAPLIAFQKNLIDAVLWSEAQTSTWVLAHPDYVSIVPAGIAAPFLMAYMVQPSSPQFLSFLNYWLELKKSDGFQKEMYDRWILIRPPENTQPRWSILNF